MSTSQQPETEATAREAQARRSDDRYNPVEFKDETSPAHERTLTDSDTSPQPPVRQGPRKYSHGFFDPQLAPIRAIYLKIVVSVTIMIILIMWACLPLYWGSLNKTPEYAYRLTTFVVDFDDNSTLSQAVVAATQASMNGSPPFLGYRLVDSGRFADIAEVIDAVHQEEAWAAIVINSGAVEKLEQARQTGNASYSGASAVSAIYNQGRNELAAGNYIVPQFAAVLAPALAQASAQSVAAYLESNAANATALAQLVQAPATLANAFSYSPVNIHPYNIPVATAITLVGMIYLLVLSFIFTMGHFGAREVIGPFLTTRSYLVLRIVVPILVYLPISFFFAMINLAFEVPFNQGPYTNAGGFFLTAFLFFLGMAALGLATEFAITLLTPKFIALFLVAWIVVNVSEASMPIELSGNHIYRIGHGLLFHNISVALRTILFGTKNYIARTCGILLGWIVLSMLTIPLVTWLMRRKDVKAEEHKRQEAADATASSEKKV